MGYKVEELFNDMDLDNEKQCYYIHQYKVIEKDFSDKKFNFKNLNIHDTYIDILLKYLKVNGYGFLSKKINKDIEQVELANLLIDSKLISKPEIGIISDLEKKIVYDKNLGCKKSFIVKFVSKSTPLEVLSFNYNNNEFLSCNLDKNIINIQLNIDPDNEVSLLETIVVYTTLGLKEIKLVVECISETNIEINIKDFDYFKKLCKRDYNEAKNIFENISFREWLFKRGYLNQVINYDEALELSSKYTNGDFNNPFKNFCKLNGIYEEENICNTQEVINAEDKELEKEKVEYEIIKEEIIENTKSNLEKKITKYNIDNTENVYKEYKRYSNEEDVKETKENNNACNNELKTKINDFKTKIKNLFKRK